MRYLWLLLLIPALASSQIVGRSSFYRPTAAAAPANLILDSLHAYWSMDEASGNRSDATGHGNTLIDSNTVTSTTGVVSNCAVFARANNELLYIPSNAHLTLSSSESWTVAFWGYCVATGSNCFIEKRGGTKNEYVFNTDADTNFRGRVYDTGGATDDHSTAASFAAGTWKFVVWWFNAATDSLYAQVDNGAYEAWVRGRVYVTSDSYFGVGGGGGGATFLNGRMDEVGIWKRVLTADERTWLYNSGSGRAYSAFGGTLP